MRLLTGSSLRLPASSSFSIFFFSLALRLLCRWHAVPRNCERKHGVWADLRRGFESLPDGAVDPSQFENAIVSLCRNTVSDPGWPPLQGCAVPAVDVSFTARTRPGPWGQFSLFSFQFLVFSI